MIVDADLITPVPWKNGGGLTRELLCGPTHDGWRWRLSLADIATNGPFSAFPGVERWFAVLSGAGVALDLPGGEQVLRPGDDPVRFDGAAAPACRLLNGPTRDLNLMLRGVDGEMRAARSGDAAPPWPVCGFFDTAMRRLHWPASDYRAPAAGFWIGIRP